MILIPTLFLVAFGIVVYKVYKMAAFCSPYVGVDAPTFYEVFRLSIKPEIFYLTIRHFLKFGFRIL